MASSESFALPLLHDHSIVDVGFDAACKVVASCALDGTVAVYNLVQQRSTHFFELNQTPSCMSLVMLQPGCFTIIVGSREGVLHQITFREDSVASTHRTLAKHREAVSLISYGHSMLVTVAGSHLVACSFDQSTDTWIKMYARVFGHQVQQIMHLDDKRLVVVTQDRQIRYLDLVTGQTLSVIKANTTISGVATAGRHLLLSTSRNCRLTHIGGRSKLTILRSPIPDARLQSIQNVPLILAEGARGDLCIWNHETGQVLVHSDRREGRLKLLHVAWNPQYPGLILARLLPSEHKPRIIIHKIPRAGVTDAIFLPVLLRQTKFKLMRT